MADDDDDQDDDDGHHQDAVEGEGREKKGGARAEFILPPLATHNITHGATRCACKSKSRGGNRRLTRFTLGDCALRRDESEECDLS